MAENQWYAFYPGDYLRDTAHLSLLEHGAYRLLIDHYYATGGPLPSDPDKLYRICGARNRHERAAVLFVSTNFFSIDDTFLRHERCDCELAKRLKFKETQSARARLRHASGSATAVPTTTTTTVSSEGKPSSDTTRARSPTYSPAFEEFWAIYPRHDCSKAEASKSYNRTVQGGTDHERIIAGVRAFGGYVERIGMGQRYIPHAATWINQRRWESDYSSERPYQDSVGVRSGTQPAESRWIAEGNRIAAKYGAEAERERQAGAQPRPGQDLLIAASLRDDRGGA